MDEAVHNRISISPVYDSYTADFFPCGEIVGYFGSVECCGEVLATEGSIPEIVYAILEGKWHAHIRTVVTHPECW